MNCVSENVLRAYHDGELDSRERPEIEKHLATCGQCGDRLREIAAVSGQVQGHLLSLEASTSEVNVDPQIALARFKTRHAAGKEHVPFVARQFARRWRPVWIGGVAAAFVLCSLAFPSGRSLAQRLLATLRIERVQPVRLDFSSLEGNRPLQQMLTQMVSDKVIVTADEKAQHFATAERASQLAGFQVRLLGALTEAPAFTVEGQHAFHMTIDRSRLQEIFDQAGRPDLVLPATLDGATISVQIPRAVRVEYGNCAHRRERDEVQRESSSGGSCLALEEAPSPLVNFPSDLNVQQLAEIGFQLAGMSAVQARELGQTIDWKSTLVLPIPRFVGSYSLVEVNGAQGTLIKESGRRGTGYALIWVKNGMIYCLAAQGDSREAVTLANSLD
ncbi:MAG TPA: zf-HC2 domain-containing protein [Candidatus Acidoferrum sp.]